MSTAKNPFRESNLYAAPIKELQLAIDDTPLAPLIAEFRAELVAKGITRLVPRFHLSTEWGVPFGTVVIGIPFYLAKPELAELHSEEVGHIEGLSHADFLRYLRHEMGHVVNYAYKLYETPQWHQLFGPYSRPYRDDFTPNPFSRDFVRHIAGWYAQKHPDEDFAETFAVWLDPGSNWREVYKEWGCHKKLLYVDRMAGQLKGAEPKVSGADYDLSREELAYSVAEHYRKYSPRLVDLPAWFDGELRA